MRPSAATALRADVRAGRRWWLLPLLLGSGSVAAGVLAAPAVAPRASYTLSVAVPDVQLRPVRDAGIAPHRKARSDGRSVRSLARTAVVPDDVDADLGAASSDTQERRFTDAAMRTGEMQSWRAGEVRHFLVASELRVSAEGSCRSFSLLTRAEGGGDSVRQFERCQSDD